MSASPATSRRGVKPAKMPCSSASSMPDRDLVRSVRSAFPRSDLSVEEPHRLASRPGQHGKCDGRGDHPSRAPDPAGGPPNQPDMARQVDKLLERKERTLHHHGHEQKRGQARQQGVKSIEAGNRLGRGKREPRAPAAKGKVGQRGGIRGPSARARPRRRGRVSSPPRPPAPRPRVSSTRASHPHSMSLEFSSRRHGGRRIRHAANPVVGRESGPTFDDCTRLASIGPESTQQ